MRSIGIMENYTALMNETPVKQRNDDKFAAKVL